MNQNEVLRNLCFESLKKKGLETELTIKRLNEELDEIAKKKDAEYFLDLYDRKLRFAVNEHNLAVVYLLDIVDRVAWEKGPGYTVPEWP